MYLGEWRITVKIKNFYNQISQLAETETPMLSQFY